jgi:hypothetical protein
LYKPSGFYGNAEISMGKEPQIVWFNIIASLPNAYQNPGQNGHSHAWLGKV